MWLKADLKHFRHQKNIFGDLESQFGGQNGQLLRGMSEIWSFEVYPGLGTHLMDHFSISWEMWSEADLKYFRRQKNILFGL